MSEQAALAAEVLDICRDARLTLAVAESCTGGLIAATLTEIAGSSDVVERGFVTYADQAKTDLIGVPEALITAHGAVSGSFSIPDGWALVLAEAALIHGTPDIAANRVGRESGLEF